MKRTIFISHYADERTVGFLSSVGEVRLLPDCRNMLGGPSERIASHADILLFFRENRLFVPESYYYENIVLFKGTEVVLTVAPGGKYPYDIPLNALPLGNVLVCNEKYTSDQLKAGYKTLNVRQGYARCSSLKLNDSAIVTADRSIADAAVSLGCDVLRIREGGICLEGFGYGFIGGASCVVGKTVVFFGDINAHPDGEAIMAFIGKYGMDIVSSDSLPLTDYGGAVMTEVM